MWMCVFVGMGQFQRTFSNAANVCEVNPKSGHSFLHSSTQAMNLFKCAVTLTRFSLLISHFQLFFLSLTRGQGTWSVWWMGLEVKLSGKSGHLMWRNSRRMNMRLHGLLEVLKLVHSQDAVLTLMPLISLPSIDFTLKFGVWMTLAVSRLIAVLADK